MERRTNLACVCGNMSKTAALMLATLISHSAWAQPALSVSSPSIQRIYLDQRGQAYLLHTKGVDVWDFGADSVRLIEFESPVDVTVCGDEIYIANAASVSAYHREDLRLLRELRLSGGTAAFSDGDQIAQLAAPRSGPPGRLYASVKVANSFTNRRVVSINTRSGLVGELLPQDETLGTIGLSHSGYVLFTQLSKFVDDKSSVGCPTFYQMGSSRQIGAPLATEMDGGLLPISQPRDAPYYVANNRVLMGRALTPVLSSDSLTIVPDMGANQVIVWSRSKARVVKISPDEIRVARPVSFPMEAFEAVVPPAVGNSHRWQALTVGDVTHLFAGWKHVELTWETDSELFPNTATGWNRALGLSAGDPMSDAGRVADAGPPEVAGTSNSIESSVKKRPPRGWKWSEIPGLASYLVPEDAEIQPIQDQGRNPTRRIEKMQSGSAILPNADAISVLTVLFAEPRLAAEEANQFCTTMGDKLANQEFSTILRDSTRVLPQGVLERDLLLRIVSKVKTQTVRLVIFAGHDRVIQVTFIAEGTRPMERSIINRTLASIRENYR